MMREKTAAGSILLLLVYVAWARGGIYGPWLFPLALLVPLVVLACGYCFALSPAPVRARLLKDPFLYVALLLVALCLIQWLNTGGTAVRDAVTHQWSYSPPKWPRAPFSIQSTMNWQPIAWFFPVAVMVPAVRHLFSRATLKWLLSALLCNGAVLALLGVVHLGLGWHKLYGLVEIPGHPTISSTFVYPNHGGAFFYLMLALSLGGAWDALEKKKPLWRAVGSALLALLFAVAAFCSLSRAAVLIVIAIIAVLPLCWLWQNRRTMTPARWVNVSLAGFVLAIFVFLSIIHLGRGAILREFGDASAAHEVEIYQGSRGWQIPPALAMFKDHPAFGVGGWGYRYYVAIYLPREQWAILSGAGKSNVHCDPVQFLAEHGLVGVSLMTAGLGLVLWPWRRLTTWRYQGRAVMVALGALMVGVHSLVDLPFRCPAILWHWLLLLAIIPQLAYGQRKSVNSEQ